MARYTGKTELSAPDLAFLGAYAVLDPHRDRVDVVKAYRAAYAHAAEWADKRILTELARLVSGDEPLVDEFLAKAKEGMRMAGQRAGKELADRASRIAKLRLDIEEARLSKTLELVTAMAPNDKQSLAGKAKMLDSAGAAVKDAGQQGDMSDEEARQSDARRRELDERIARIEKAEWEKAAGAVKGKAATA